MKKIAKKKSLLLLLLGMFVVAASQIFSHYLESNDFTTGLFMGVGIGLLLISIIFGNFKTAE